MPEGSGHLSIQNGTLKALIGFAYGEEEARQTAQLTHHRGRRRLRYPARRLQRFDYRADLRRCLLHRVVNRFFQLYDPSGNVIDLFQIVRHRGVQSLLLEARVKPDPVHILRRPRLSRIDGALTVVQQKFSQPMPVSQLVLLRRFARPHRIARRLVRRVRQADPWYR
jgi:hypothetical protein